MPAMLNETMDDYRKLVADVMASAIKPEARGPRVFDNFGTEHAQVVVDAMLRAATKEICIYACRVSAEVYDGSLLREFIAKHPEGMVRILVEADAVFDDPKSALFGLKDLEKSGRFEVRKTVPRTRHMLIVDGTYVRIENSQEQRKAIVAFGEPSLIKASTELFNILWSIIDEHREATAPPEESTG